MIRNPVRLLRLAGFFWRIQVIHPRSHSYERSEKF